MTTSYLLFDTCVWLSLAQDPDALHMLNALKGHIEAKSVVLLVPTIVSDEFDRHQERIIDKHNERLKTCVKHAREASHLLDGSEAEQMRGLVEKAATQITNKASAIAHALTIVKELLAHRSSIRMGQTDMHYSRVVSRALAKLAPFHRHKNSVADALLMECFHDYLTSETVSGKAIFVTENTSDYCDEKKKSEIHDHYKSIFNEPNITFSINVAKVIADLGPFEHAAAATARYASDTRVGSNACPGGGAHSFDDGRGAYLRSQYGGLTWQLLCDKCGARFDTGEHWD